MTNREFIVREFESGHTVWRYTNTSGISYTKINNGVWRVRHGLCSCTDKTISMQTAISQLLRNFKQISNIH